MAKQPNKFAGITGAKVGDGKAGDGVDGTSQAESTTEGVTTTSTTEPATRFAAVDQAALDANAANTAAEVQQDSVDFNRTGTIDNSANEQTAGAGEKQVPNPTTGDGAGSSPLGDQQRGVDAGQPAGMSGVAGVSTGPSPSADNSGHSWGDARGQTPGDVAQPDPNVLKVAEPDYAGEESGAFDAIPVYNALANFQIAADFGNQTPAAVESTLGATTFSSTIASLSMGSYQFEGGILRFDDADKAAKFEALLATQPLPIRNQVRKVDLDLASQIARQHAQSQGRMVTGVDTTANTLDPPKFRGL